MDSQSATTESPPATDVVRRPSLYKALRTGVTLFDYLRGSGKRIRLA